MKPILKKISYSEKGSLDLDRGWDDQQIDGMWEPIGTGKSAKDVSFSFGTAGARGSSDGRSALSGKEGITTGSSSSSGNVVRKTFHQRSHSGNSVATNGSGGMRAGSFVHPFQQMPRTSTPPLSYANSLVSFDNSSGNAAREYSPTITENEDDDGETSLAPHLHLTNLNHHHHQTQHASFSSTGHQPTLSTHSSTFSQTGLRRPSLASQRTSSLTDITSVLVSTSQLRVATNNGRSTPTTSRLAPSKSDLHLNLTLSELESPVGSFSGIPTLISATTAPAASPASSTPMSPLRTSLEAMGIPTPRLRSRSEVDTAVRQEHIRQARRKFDERERAKEAKYEREEVERRNRQANKEAARIERETKEWYKATGVSSGGVGVGVAGFAAARGSNSVHGSFVDVNSSTLHGESILQAPPACATIPGRPSASRRTTPTSVATTSASVPTHPTGSRSVGAGVFGGKRKGSFGVVGTTAGSRPDFLAAGGYPSNGSSSRKNSGLGKENQANVGDAEKGISFLTNNYDSLPAEHNMPRFGPSIDDAQGAQQGYDWRRDRPRRSSNAKRKTQTYWQGFVMWLRTRIFKLRKR